MAEYWNGLIEGREPIVETNIENLKNRLDFVSNEIFASGNNIDFDTFFNFRRKIEVETLNCIIIDSEIPICQLSANSVRSFYHNNIVFQNCQIKYLLINSFNIQKISFQGCIIDRLEIFRGDIKELEIIEDSKIRPNDSNLSNSSLIRSASFEGVNFSAVNFSKSTLNDFSIQNCKFSSFKLSESSFDKFLIYDSHLMHVLTISDCKKGADITFSLCKFDVNELDIKKCAINIYFIKLRIYNKIVFRFNESQQTFFAFYRCYFGEETLFQGNTFQDSKNLLIQECVFKDLVMFDDDNARSLQFLETLFQKGVLLPTTLDEGNIVDSSVWCTLKNQALSRNDQINALHYKKLELESYVSEIKDTKKYQEKLLLWLNRISNNHGSNWGRGVLFTILCWLLFYTLFAMASDNFNGINLRYWHFLYFEKTFWSDAINYLWLPQGMNKLTEGLNNNLCWVTSIIMVITYILGKILVAYGIFQTISAFRKHGKL